MFTNLDAMIQKIASHEKVFYQLIIEEVVIKDKDVEQIEDRWAGEKHIMK